MRATAFVNGRVTDARDAVVPLFDHGFLYGEGIYETLRTYERAPFLLDRHLARLRHSASLMRLDVPWSDAELATRVADTMHAACADDSSNPAAAPEAYIRILVTRGVGELTYNPAACPTPTLVILVKPLPVFPERTFAEGIRLALVGIRRNHPDALNPMIKSNNLLNNALAMQEALRNGADEALMQNQHGDIVECAQSNVFVVRRGELVTPPLEAGLLPGITRAFILELAREDGIAARQDRVTPADVFGADEVFITGTTREVTPVVRVDDQKIGTGTPGPVTRALLAAFRARTARRTTSGTP